MCLEAASPLRTFHAMSRDLDFEAAVTRISAMIGENASAVVSGNDRRRGGVVVELTGVLRQVGPDPDDPQWGQSGPRVFGFAGRQDAFYLDPDAFVSAWGSKGFVHIETSFGSIEIAGPISRPDWF